MDRINVETMRGFGVTRRRGTETGGVLLGRIDRKPKTPVIYIYDIEVVPCEYAAGPSYVLSPTDEQRFRDAVARWQPSLDRDSYAVGYFRSHTRDGFTMDERDAAVMREFFRDPVDVALLIKPFATRAATAGFFLKEKGELVTASTPLEFKFETPARPAAAAQETPPAPAPEPKARAVAPTAVAAPPTPAATRSRPPRTSPLVAPDPQGQRDLFAAEVAPPSGRLRALSWTAFFAALLAFGAACGYEYAGRTLEAQRRPAVPAGAGTPTGLPNADLYTVHLQVSQAGSSVMVKWNRDAAPIQAALHGVLTVTEGANSKEVKLGFAELRNGAAMYPLIAPEIRFRLEIFFKNNRSFVESAVFTQAPAP